jgi:hypothetical protein
MQKGSHHTEESKLLVKLARSEQKSPLIGTYGITEESYKHSKGLGLIWCRECKQFLEPELFYNEAYRK